MKKFKKIVIGLVCTLVIIILASAGYVYAKLNSIYVKDEPTKKQSQSAKKDDVQGEEVEGITNILLVGIDGANIERGNRSDATMLLTIDNNTKNIKITSIARDTYVDIPGHSTEKLTHAYAYGGIDLLKEVFRINFGINVDKYIAVNFVSFMDVMDEIGGVEVNIEEKDINEVNKYIDHCYDGYYSNKDNVKKEYITNAGIQRLNGYQALAFSRIRYTDSAYARDNRHREVAQSVYNELLTKDFATQKKVADILLENTKTNINPIEMLNLGFTAIKINDKKIEQLQFPLAEHRNGHIINKRTGWVIEWDKEPNLEAWNKFIFGTENETSSESQSKN